LREFIFARGLIARLAPKDDDDLPKFERELVDEIKSAGIDGLGLQLNVDLHDDEALKWICSGIRSAYGSPLAPEEAAQRAEQLIEEENERIRVVNTTHPGKINWHNEIDFPYF